MKNHIFFKFIAIILCAASLTGAIGSALGIIVLTEGDLYNKTVAQMVEDEIASDTYDYAFWLARNYAGTELGGCSDDMINQRYGSHWFTYQYDPQFYGYAILDAEGNELLSSNAHLKETAQVHTIPITGQYMHLVSAESEAEAAAREAREEAAAYSQEAGSSEVPAEGISINHVAFLDRNGSLIYEAEGRRNGDSESTYYFPDGGIVSNGHSDERTGYLFYNSNGELVYNSFFEDAYVDFPETEVAEYIFFNSDNGFLLTSHNPEGLGVISNPNGNLRFVSYFTLTAPVQENAPVTVEETIPEEPPGWVVETVPGSDSSFTLTRPDGTSVEVVIPQKTEVVPETTPPELPTEALVAEETIVPTYAETIPSSASAVPEETAYTETAPVATEVMETEALAPETTGIPDTTEIAETSPTETVPETTEPVIINGKKLEEYQINRSEYYDSERQENMTAQFVYVPMPEMTVEVYMAEGVLRKEASYDVLSLIRQYRDFLLPAVGICLLVFAIFAVYLCTAAGRKPKSDEVKAGGLNRLSLDVYLFGGGFAAACLIYCLEFVDTLLEQDFLLGCGLAVGALFLCCLIFVAFLFAFVAQIKTPGGFWWRNSLCGICMQLFMRFAVWLETSLSTKGFPFLGRLIKGTWRFTCKAVVWSFHAFETSVHWMGEKLGRALRWMGRKLHRFLSLLPLAWQWMLAGFSSIFLLFLTVAGRYDMGTILSVLFSIALVLYGAYCFGNLAESTRRMSKGDLDTKVDDRLMVGCFKEFSGDLSALADVAVVAAQKQLKSERMKTELITNVSHDIKTPLTSIINYVDLLQKPHTQEEEGQYLEVLDRQSQRLKKLIDDLMDMSKANTGNMAVEITQLNAVESVNQALGEFADKLDRAQLIPVFRCSEELVPMMADGKLVWRVLSNLLGNAVKYAMPGTRLYIDLMTMEGKVVISLKNISREELNIDADELMERFVRGDDSRNTEGSGLGLNIAKSLMELQKGQLQLLVDGDLFKVTLIFPGA